MKGSWWVGVGELIDEQREVIALPAEGSHLVMGPPGSGKTNLLILRAHYLSLSGHQNLLILTFTRTLREFISSGGHRYAFPAEKVQTYSYWQHRFLVDHGVSPEVSEEASKDFDLRRRELLSKLQATVESKGLRNSYSAILIDEAQDYRPEELQLFNSIAERVFLVADSRQQIYKGNATEPDLVSLVDFTHRLRHHHRCGREICRVADGLARASESLPPLEDSSNYDEVNIPSELHYERHADEKRQLEAMKSRISLQLRAYPDELIGVLVPKRKLLDSVRIALEQSEFSNIVTAQQADSYVSFDNQHRVHIATMHSAKGCEFRCVHMPIAEELSGLPLPRNVAFTAVTRAQSSLSIYHTNTLLGFFEQAVDRVANPDRKPPRIDDLFGGGHV